MRIKNKHHLCKCLLPTLLSIWHGHNDGLTYSTCWNGVQISKLNSICNYCDDLLTPWTNYLLNCTIHRFCSNYFLRSHYWKKKKKCENQWTYTEAWREVCFCSASFAVLASFLWVSYPLSCVLTLCDHMDCSLLGSSVCGILQARILEWVAMPSSRGSSQTSDQTQVSCMAGRFFTIWAPREAIFLIQESFYMVFKFSL